MKKLLILLFVIVSLPAFSQVKLAGYITTFGPSDTYPLQLDSLGAGGYMVSLNKTTRDAIPTARKKKGMYVYCYSIDSSYLWTGSAWKHYKLPSMVEWIAQTSKAAFPGFGTSSSTAAQGNHTHTEYAATSHTQGISTITGLQDSINNRYRRSDTNSVLLSRTRAQHDYEGKISVGTTSQYWRGDKSWQALPGYQWAINASNIYYNTGNVGVGTTNPLSKMSVVTSSPATALFASSTHASGMGINAEGVLFGIQSFSTAGTAIYASTTTGKAAVFMGGNVGIGKTDPSSTLDVNGIITATGGNSTSWNTAAGWGNHAIAGYLTTITATAPLSYSSGTISIPAASTSTNGYLSSTNWNTFNNKVSSQWVTNGSNIYYNSGNIGISTNSPTAGLDVQNSSFVLGGNADPNASGSINSTDATIVKQYSHSLIRRSSTEIAKMDIGGIGFIPTVGSVYAMSNISKFWPLSNLQYNFKRAYGYSHDIVLTDSTHSSVILKDTVFLPKIGKRTSDMTTTDSIIVSVPVVTNYGGGTDSKMIRKMEVAPVSALPFAGKTHVHPVKIPLLITNDSIAISQANTTTPGFLSANDWNAFNNKVSSQWTTNGSSVYSGSGINVGIGGLVPTEALEVDGNIKVDNVIQRATLLENNGYSGDIIPLTVKYSMKLGDVIFIGSDGLAVKCIASTIANCPYALAVCVSEVLADNGPGLFMTKGSVRNDTWNWPVGSLLYIGTTGQDNESMTSTPPSSSNNVIMPVAVALSSTEIYFFGNMNSVEKL